MALTDNLVAYYKFDEASGTTSNDSVGSVNGTITGATVNQTGKISKCYTYNGTTGNYVNYGNNFGTVFTGAHTINTWCYFNNFSTYNALLTKTDSGANAKPIDIYTVITTGKMRYFLSNGGAPMYVEGNITIPTGQWVMVTFTYSGNNNSTGMNIYINGVLDSVTRSGAVTPTNGTDNCLLGTRNGGTTAMNGGIDEMGIRNRELSSTEVALLYDTNRGNQYPFHPLTLTLGEYLGDTVQTNELYTTSLYSDANLVSYWRLNETTGTSVADSKGSNTGTATAPTWSSGKFSNCMVFNGSSSKIAITDARTYTASTHVFWVNPTSLTGGSKTIFFNTDQNYFLDINANGTLRRATQTGTYNLITSTTAVTTGNWYMVAIVYTGANKYFYINGTQDATSAAITGNITTSGTSYIGSYDGTSGFFNGSIDDVAIFSRALSASEINNLYKVGATKGLYHLNGNSTDASGNGFNGTDSNVTYSLANGKFGQGAGYTGATNSYTNLGNVFNLGVNTVGTFSVWFKKNSVRFDTILTKNPASVFSGYGMFAEENGKLQFWKIIPSQYVGVETNTGVISPGNWYNCICVVNGANSKLYVNGVSQTLLTNQNMDTGDSTNTNSLSLGGSSINTGYTCNGNIDEVIIENVARSPEKVSRYYSMAKGRYGSL